MFFKREHLFDNMEFIEVATEIIQVRDSERKNLHHGHRNRDEKLYLSLLEEKRAKRGQEATYFEEPLSHIGNTKGEAC